MTTEFDNIKNILNFTSGEVAVPEVKQSQDLEYRVLFVGLMPHKISTAFIEYIYKCFKKYDFFVEFYFVTPSKGLYRSNLGELYKIIESGDFFKNTIEFQNATQNIENDYSINIIICVGQKVSHNEFMICDLAENDWFLKLKKKINDTFQPY